MANDADFTPNLAGIHHLLEGRTGDVQRDLDRRARNVAAKARQLASGHGSMKRRISTNQESGHVRVELTHPAAVFVLQGTKPHVIVSRRPGGKLRFKVQGKTVFARVVHHPGYKGDDFLTRALREAAR